MSLASTDHGSFGTSWNVPVSRDLAQVDREERRREGAPDPGPEALDRRPRAPRVDRHALVEEGCEEPKALKVVEMEVREQQLDALRSALLQVVAELPDPGAGVEHENGAVLQRDQQYVVEGTRT